jgi:hypothetical protein
VERRPRKLVEKPQKKVKELNEGDEPSLDFLDRSSRNISEVRKMDSSKLNVSLGDSHNSFLY